MLAKRISIQSRIDCANRRSAFRTMASQDSKAVNIHMAGATQPDIPYNFAPATGRPDEILHGCMRPGSQIMGTPGQKVTEAELLAYADEMKANGISVVIGLLSSDELETGYVTPPAQLLSPESNNGIVAYNVNESDFSASVASVMKLVDAAEASHKKVVLHCWGGSGRTGTMLAALAVKRYGLTVDEAVEEIQSYSASKGAKREFKIKNLQSIV